MRPIARLSGTGLFMIAVTVSVAAAAGEGNPLVCERSLDAPHPLSLQGKAAELFRDITRIGEAQTKHPIRLDEVVRHLVACWGKAARLRADSPAPDTAPFATIAGIPLAVEGGELAAHTPEGTIRLAVRADGDAARLAQKMARSLKSAMGEERWEGGVRDAVWYLWVESYLDWLREPYNHYVYADELPFERTQDRGKSFGPGFTVEFAADRVIVKELFDDTLVRLGVAPGAELEALDGRDIRSLGRRDLIGYWHRREPFDYQARFAGIAHGKPVEATSVPHRFRSISWSRLGTIGYVRIHFFSDDTPIEFRRIARRFGREGIESLIIDVRGNGGGRRVIGFIDFFLKPAQYVASYKELYEEEDPVDVKGTVEYYDYPLVVLVDGESASMSELLAAAIQTNQRGTVVGETTSGKGVGQTIYPIGEEGELALVRTLYYYPGTRDSWNGVGIVPDLAIEPSDEGSGLPHELPGTMVLDLERQLEWDRGLQEGVRILEATR